MKKAAFCLLVVLSFVGCSKTLEGETKAWNKNTESLQALKTLYPGFAAALDEQLKKAKAAMDAANGVTDQEAKIEKMAAANKLLSGGLVGQLREAETTTKRIRKKIIDVTGSAVDESDRLSAKAATDDAQRVLTNTEATLKQGAPNAVAAGTILKKVMGDLKSAESNLSRAASIASKKRQQARAAKQQQAKANANTNAAPKTGAAGAVPAAATSAGATQAASAPAAPAGATPAAVVHWKCPYCGSQNLQKATECKSCGAPRK